MTLRLPTILAAALLACAVSRPVLAQSVYTIYEDARKLASDDIAVTPKASSLVEASGGESSRFGALFGARVDVGIWRRADVSVAFDRFQLVGEQGGFNFMNAAVKVPIQPGRLAVFAPIGFAFGGGADVGQSVHLDPGVVYTRDLTKTIDLNPSARVIVPFCDGCEALVGFELGVGVHVAHPRMVARPTLGVLVNPRRSGAIWTFGGAVTMTMKRP